MQTSRTYEQFLTFGAYLRKFVQLLETDYMIPAEQVLKGVNLSRDALEQPDVQVPFSDCVAVFCNGVALCPDAGLSLRFASRLRSGSHGLLWAATLTAATLEEAVQLFYDYVSLVAPFVLLHLEERRSSRTLVLDIIGSVPVVEVFAFDMLQLASFNILKMILGSRTCELVFHFTCPAPAHIAVYYDYFNCHLQFNASFNGVSIPSGLMKTGIPTADAEAHRLLMEQICGRMHILHARSSFVDAVRYHIKRQPGPLPRMNRAAAYFNMSARTLRNRLQHYNVTYQALLDQERLEKAQHYLRYTGKSVKEISYAIGFQESSNFSRVFKKWMGMTPLEFRRARSPESA